MSIQNKTHFLIYSPEHMNDFFLLIWSRLREPEVLDQLRVQILLVGTMRKIA